LQISVLIEVQAKLYQSADNDLTYPGAGTVSDHPHNSLFKKLFIGFLRGQSEIGTAIALFRTGHVRVFD
jgi:hypothetical protein